MFPPNKFIFKTESELQASLQAILEHDFPVLVVEPKIYASFRNAKYLVTMAHELKFELSTVECALHKYFQACYSVASQPKYDVVVALNVAQKLHETTLFEMHLLC